MTGTIYENINIKDCKYLRPFLQSQRAVSSVLSLKTAGAAAIMSKINRGNCKKYNVRNPLLRIMKLKIWLKP